MISFPQCQPIRKSLFQFLVGQPYPSSWGVLWGPQHPWLPAALPLGRGGPPPLLHQSKWAVWASPVFVDAFDNDLMHKTLKNIVEGKTVEVPTYDFVTHSRLPETTVVYPADVVLFEGILVFYTQEIRDMFHLRLFVDTDPDVRLS